MKVKYYQCSWFQTTVIRTKMEQFHAHRPTNIALTIFVATQNSGKKQDFLCRIKRTHFFSTKFRFEIIIISIQPEGRFWQEPEPSQATGMALAHCILGSFLGVVCHCFPPPLDVPTFASRWLHVQVTWETSISERRNYGREMASAGIKPTILGTRGQHATY